MKFFRTFLVFIACLLPSVWLVGLTVLFIYLKWFKIEGGVFGWCCLLLISGFIQSRTLEVLLSFLGEMKDSDRDNKE